MFSPFFAINRELACIFRVIDTAKARRSPKNAILKHQKWQPQKCLKQGPHWEKFQIAPNYAQRSSKWPPNIPRGYFTSISIHNGLYWGLLNTPKGLKRAYFAPKIQNMNYVIYPFISSTNPVPDKMDTQQSSHNLPPPWTCLQPLTQSRWQSPT